MFPHFPFSRSLSLAGLALLFLTCKKDDPVNPAPPDAPVTLVFQNKINGQPLAFGPAQFTNALGSPFTVEVLKYYVTNAALVRADGTAHEFRNYDLIDADDAASCRISATGVPNGTYAALRFLLGIDSTRNHTGAQDGDLDPVHGMAWNWSTGYIFFKHEGRFTDTAGTDLGLIFHYGTDASLTAVDIPFDNGLTVQGVGRTVYVDFDLGRLYASPHAIDFNEDNFRQSATSADRVWLGNMKENFPGAFQLDRVE